MISKFKTLLPLSLVVLASCGPVKKKQPLPIETFNASAPKSATQVAVLEKLIEPSQFGAGWSRALVLEADQKNKVIVEARSAESADWALLGLTSASGTFIDTNIAQSRQYRFGGVYVSQLLPAITDIVVEGSPTNALTKAFRIVLRSKVSLNIKSYAFEAFRIVIEPNAKIQAFEPGAIGGFPAGSLFMRAEQIVGNLAIDLRGANGAGGAPGAAGRNGHKGALGEAGENGAHGAAGWSGNPGGNGGSAVIECANPRSIDPSKIQVDGGLGGLGGQGGAGGAGGAGGEVWQKGNGRLGIDPERMPDAPAGQPGRAGPKGSDGVNGTAGTIAVNKLVVPIGFERYSEALSLPLALTEERSVE